MTNSELIAALREFHRDKLTLRQRHAAVAQYVSDYEFNNTYQYIIAREDVHLSWLEAALSDLSATADDLAVPAVQAPGKKESFLPLVQEDARGAGEFIAKWRLRLGGVTHARHRGMMQVVLNETAEQKRFFDQMLAGRDDLLGRRANGPGSPGTGDGVMAVRWIG